MVTIPLQVTTTKAIAEASVHTLKNYLDALRNARDAAINDVDWSEEENRSYHAEMGNLALLIMAFSQADIIEDEFVR